ncbi:MAG: flagellar hook-associated protein FlgL [Enterobacteriaceae bacterium]
MRLSTFYMYQNNIDSLSKAMNNGHDVYSRLSAGKMLLTPADDPAGASQAVIYQNARARIDQYATARMYAQDSIGLEENILSNVGNILTGGLAEKIVAAGDGAYSNEDRKALATELQGIRDNLMGLANTRDSNGRYIFSGYNTNTPPFNEDGTYVGGDTPISQKVADNTDMQVGHTGNTVFTTPDNIFQALDEVIAALNTPVESDDEREALRAVLDKVNVSIKKSIDNLGKVEAEVGTNLQQLERLGFSADAQDIELQSRLQQTVGSDPNTMVTMIAQSKMTEFSLQASMMVFQSMQQMSLFNQVR